MVFTARWTESSNKYKLINGKVNYYTFLAQNFKNNASLRSEKMKNKKVLFFLRQKLNSVLIQSNKFQ